MLEKIGTYEAPGAPDLLTRKDTLAGERQDGLGAHTKEMRGFVGCQYLRIFLHLLLTPEPVPDLTLLGRCDRHGCSTGGGPITLPDRPSDPDRQA